MTIVKQLNTKNKEGTGMAKVRWEKIIATRTGKSVLSGLQ